MAAKKNERCPLQVECEKKCTFQHRELECDYYEVNARPNYYIEDQEKKRRERERQQDEQMWEEMMNSLEDEEEEAEDQEDPKEAAEPEELEEPEARRLAVSGGVTYLDGPMGVTEKIKKAMYDVARQFVYIGFLLWEVKQYHYYREKGYKDVYEYAEAELGFKRSSTKNFIAISETFGNKYYNSPYTSSILPTMQLKPTYEQFNYSQLCEMLSMSPAKRATVTPDMTIKQIREIKKQPEPNQEPELPPDMKTIQIPLPDDKPDETVGQTSGQIKEIQEEEIKFPKWISIKDRLPKRPGPYLVSYRRSGKYERDKEWKWRDNVREYKGYYTEVCQRWWNGDCWAGYDETVTHWLPLPEAPQ